MPRTKKVAAPTPAEPVMGETTTTEGHAEVVVPQVSDKTEFAVHRADGGYVRTYSLADHGENAEALAHQFASKIGGTVV